MRPSLVEIQGHPPPNAPSPLSFQAHIETGGEGRMSVHGTALLFLLGVCHSDAVRPRRYLSLALGLNFPFQKGLAQG